MWFEQKHPLPRVRHRVVCQHEPVYSSHHLIIHQPLHLIRRTPVAEYGERLRKRKPAAVLVHRRGGVPRERQRRRRPAVGRREQLTPDHIHARTVHRAETAQQIAISVIGRALRNVLAVEMPAGDHSVRPAPVADRQHVPLHEQIGTHFMVVDADPRKAVVRFVLAQKKILHVRTDVVALLRLEHLIEIRRPSQTRTIPCVRLRHVRLVGEGEAHRLPDIVRHRLGVRVVRKRNKRFRHPLLDHRRIRRIAGVRFNDNPLFAQFRNLQPPAAERTGRIRLGNQSARAAGRPAAFVV